jgi:hypothetical protein
MITPKLAFAFCASIASTASAQGTFGNLDFESANLAGYSPGSAFVPVSAALPSWTALFGTSQLSQVGYDAITLGSGAISVIDSSTPVGSPIAGTYSALLMGAGQGIPPDAPSTISQTGVIPPGTLSLLVKMWTRDAASPPIVSLGGQTLNMTPLQILPNYTLYGANISSFAGQTTALSFTAPPPAVGSPSFLMVDDITFSVVGVPEPTTPALSAFGGLALAFWAFRRSYRAVRPNELQRSESAGRQELL